MQKICAAIVWLAIGLAAVSGPALSEKQNVDQDTANKKKQEASEPQKLPLKHSALNIKQLCASLGGRYSQSGSIRTAKGTAIPGSAGYACVSGCGSGGCNLVTCDADSESCWKVRNWRPSRPGGGKNVDDVRAGAPPVSADDILGSGPPLSVNGPSRTGTPKPAPPPPPVPTPNPG